MCRSTRCRMRLPEIISLYPYPSSGMTFKRGPNLRDVRIIANPQEESNTIWGGLDGTSATSLSRLAYSSSLPVCLTPRLRSDSLRPKGYGEMAKAKTEVEKHPRESKFAKVDRGVCPHDESELEGEVAGRGDGVTRKCATCEHVWYINRRIKTCKCLTCGKQKETHRLTTKIPYVKC